MIERQYKEVIFKWIDSGREYRYERRIVTDKEKEQLKIKNQKQENLINSQNKVIEELENWFDKWGFDVVNYRILDEIMEHFLGDD